MHQRCDQIQQRRQFRDVLERGDLVRREIQLTMPAGLVEAEVARIEGLFIQPDFHRKHATQVNRLTDELEAAKENITKLYARWEELEAIKAAAARP